MIVQLDVSLTFIALCVITMFFMISAVGLRRSAVGVLRGDGNDPILFKRIRIHGNFVEVAPLVALVLLAAELIGIGDGWLWTVVALFAMGRVYHWLRYDSPDRGVGMALTTMPSAALAVALLFQLWGT